MGRKGSLSLESRLSIPSKNLPAHIGKLHATVGRSLKPNDIILSYYYYKIEYCEDRRYIPLGSQPVTQAKIEGDSILKLRWDVQKRVAINSDFAEGPTEYENVVPCLVKTKVWADLRATLDCKLKKLSAAEGQWITSSSDSAVAIVEEACGHDVVYSGMCALCGKDLSQIENTKLSVNASVERMRADIAVAHDETRVTVSRREAQRMDDETARRLLKTRRLSLILDLDQTVIHAAVDPTVGEWKRDRKNPNYNVLQDVHEFVLPDSSCVYYVKLRPHTRRFLSELSQLFELHIYTMGTRSYANAIAEIIDPNGDIFKERILSRDENGSVTLKSLKRLFPCDQSMVVVVDDRADVWQWSPNLLNIPCYNFFAGVGDINSELINQAKQSLEATVTDEKIASEGFPALDSQSATNLNQIQKQTVDTQIKDRPLSKSLSASEVPNPLVLDDSDDQLLHILYVLKRIHELYFELYEGKRLEDWLKPDVQLIVPYLKHKVLANTRILFSGVFPLFVEPKDTPFGITVQLYGAEIADSLDQRVTHLVAARMGTYKVAEAQKRKDVHIVTLDWLTNSIAQFSHLEESDYLLKGTAPAAKVEIKARELSPKPGTPPPTFQDLAGPSFRGLFPRDTMSLHSAPGYGLVKMIRHTITNADSTVLATTSRPVDKVSFKDDEMLVSPDSPSLEQLEVDEWDELIKEAESSEEETDSDVELTMSSKADLESGEEDEDKRNNSKFKSPISKRKIDQDDSYDMIKRKKS